MGLFARFKDARREGLDRQLSVLWDNVRELIALEFLDGRKLVVDIDTASTASHVIRHQLGRHPRGWFSLRRQACQVLQETAADQDTITLQITAYTAPAQLQLWVY